MYMALRNNLTMCCYNPYYHLIVIYMKIAESSIFFPREDILKVCPYNML